MEFQGRNYTHRPMREMRETDTSAVDVLSDWIKEAEVYEYAHYYSYIVFHTPEGFMACYADNVNNHWFF